MNESVKTTFWVLLYAVAAAISLFLFTQIESMVKYLFSLLAIYMGIRFFRKFDTLGLRITFIVLAIVFYFLAAIIYAMYVFVKENPEALTSLV